MSISPTVQKIVNDKPKLRFGTYVDRPSAADPEDEEEEEEEDEEEESKSTISRWDNSFDPIGPTKPRRSKPKPRIITDILKTLKTFQMAEREMKKPKLQWKV